MLRVFISSVQGEFATERLALRDYLRADPLLRRFFEPFIFEDVPAGDRRADEVYLDEVGRCDIFLGLLGDDYGSEDREGVSPVQREFDHAGQRHKHRLIFIKGADGRPRHPKMQALIRRVDGQLVRKRFVTPAELIAGVYASLVHLLEERELIRHSPFDAAHCQGATLADLDPERMTWFIREARRARGFPLAETAGPEELLTHLNLLNAGRPTHAAVLLFGRQPQRFLISSEIKCAHFHGAQVAKPIPSYQVYKGTVFSLVDQAVDFVLAKLALSVGTRAEGNQAPVAYEIPPEVVREAIVNAVAHRDYTSNGSVQVMLFSDRLEVWNPGGLPAGLTLDMLREPHGSIPGNPLLAEPLYLTKYIERMGTGTRDMIRRCREAALPEPDFLVRDGFVIAIGRPVGAATGEATPQVASQVKPPVPKHLEELATLLAIATPQVTPQLATQVTKLLLLAEEPRSREELQRQVGLADRKHFREALLNPLLAAGWLEMTIPDVPRSRLQKYRLTPQGRAWLKQSGHS